MSDMGIKKDVPIILNSIDYEDSYQGDFVKKKPIIYTMSFTTKFFLYGPVTSSKVIKTVQVDQYSNLPDVTPTREQRYTVTPNPLQIQMMILDLMKQHLSLRMLRILTL